MKNAVSAIDYALSGIAENKCQNMKLTIMESANGNVKCRLDRANFGWFWQSGTSIFAMKHWTSRGTRNKEIEKEFCKIQEGSKCCLYWNTAPSFGNKWYADGIPEISLLTYSL